MKNKKGIIILIIVLNLIIISFLTYYFLSHINKPVDNKPEYITVEMDIIDENNDEVVEEDKTSDDIKDNDVKDNTDDNKPVQNDNQSDNKPVEPSAPTITYSCPSGYTLNGTKCTSIIDANHVCPENTYDYSNEGIPRDTYCVNLSEGYQSDTNSCPDNYGVIAVLGFGTPTTYQCLPLHEKIYTCPEGYSLDGSKCTSIVEATQN